MHNLRPHRTHDGKYTFNGKTYDKLFGSRQEVWDGISYKTTGELHRPKRKMRQKQYKDNTWL
jgi:hypothetical protein